MEQEAPQFCGRCNRRVKSGKSRETGFGPVCYGKVLAERALSEAQEKENSPLQRATDQAV